MRFLGVVALCLLVSSSARADVIAAFAAEPTNVRRVTTTSFTPIITNGGNQFACHGIALRPSTSQMYVASASNDNISLCNMDGTGCTPIIMDALPGDIVLDEAGGKVYWASFNGDRVYRANLDGSDPVMLVDEAYGGSLWALDLDLVNGKMYWTSWADSLIKRANLDGSMIEVVTPLGVGEPRALALDVAAGKMYWADDGTAPAIQRANLDGTNPEVLVTTLVNSPWGLALDLAAGKLYWADVGFIGVANLDGTSPAQWADAGSFQLSGFALQLTPAQMMPDAGVDGPPDAAMPDAAIDAPGGESDAGVGSDAGTNAFDGESGCGCGASSDAGAGFVLVVLVAGGLLRRPRERSGC